ncbi:MAG: flavin reductase [Succinivibrionaceae bacterium]|nr:flavin reductase [Succinivibrionaceae bacterium]
MANLPQMQMVRGLYVLGLKDSKNRDAGCVVTALTQVETSPEIIVISTRRNSYTSQNLSFDTPLTVSILARKCSHTVIEKFGYFSGADIDKWSTVEAEEFHGLPVLTKSDSTGCLYGKICGRMEYRTHYLWFVQITDSKVLSSDRPLSVRYFLDEMEGLIKQSLAGDVEEPPSKRRDEAISLSLDDEADGAQGDGDLVLDDIAGTVKTAPADGDDEAAITLEMPQEAEDVLREAAGSSENSDAALQENAKISETSGATERDGKEEKPDATVPHAKEQSATSDNDLIRQLLQPEAEDESLYTDDVEPDSEGGFETLDDLLTALENDVAKNAAEKNETAERAAQETPSGPDLSSKQAPDLPLPSDDGPEAGENAADQDEDDQSLEPDFASALSPLSDRLSEALKLSEPEQEPERKADAPASASVPDGESGALTGASAEATLGEAETADPAATEISSSQSAPQEPDDVGSAPDEATGAPSAAGENGRQNKFKASAGYSFTIIEKKDEPEEEVIRRPSRDELSMEESLKGRIAGASAQQAPGGAIGIGSASDDDGGGKVRETLLSSVLSSERSEPVLSFDQVLRSSLEADGIESGDQPSSARRSPSIASMAPKVVSRPPSVAFFRSTYYCPICRYEYSGRLPANFTCPVCGFAGTEFEVKE